MITRMASSTLAFVGYQDEQDGAVLEPTATSVDAYELGTATVISLEVADAKKKKVRKSAPARKKVRGRAAHRWRQRYRITPSWKIPTGYKIELIERSPIMPAAA